MSSVSPSTDTSLSNYYQKEAARLEDVIHQEARKTREKNDEQVRRSEERYKENLLKKEEDAASAMQSVRDSADEAIQKERAKYNEAVDRLRDRNYNNRGVSGGGNPQASGELEDYYHRGFDKLTEQQPLENAKREKLHEQEIARLKNAYETDLNRKDEAISNSIQEMRNAANESLRQEKDNHFTEVEKLKSQYYNNKGQLANRVPYEVYKKEIEDQEQLSDKRHANDLKQKELDLERQQNAHRSDILKMEAEEKNKAEYMANATSEALKHEREAHLSATDKLKKENTDLKNRGSIDIPYKEHARILQNTEDAAENKHLQDLKVMDQIEKSNRHKTEELNRENSLQLRQQADADAAQMHYLAEQLATVNDFNRDESKKQSESVARALHDYEDTNRWENLRQQKSYEDTIDRLHHGMQTSDETLSRKVNQTLKEKDTHWANVISKTESENFRNLKDLQDQFQNQTNLQNTARIKERQKNEQMLENAVERAYEQRDAALELQAKEYTQAMNSQKKSTNQEIETLQRSLQRQRTSNDTALMSPAAEAALQNRLTKEYEKTLNTEIEKNKSMSDQLQQKYIDSYKKAVEDFADKEEQLNRQTAYNQQAERAQYRESLLETEEGANQKLRTEQINRDREQDHLLRQFGIVLERQKKDFEHAYLASKEDSSAKFAALQQESDLNAKTAQRAFARQQNELSREYEKKLADQKAEHDIKMDDFKAEVQLKARDMERRSKEDLEVLAKGYEQRIAQLESQMKERERYLGQNYQDELDRTKRSYELLSKKKS